MLSNAFRIFTFIFTTILIQTSLFASCPCDQVSGHCECPHGQCACVLTNGHCDCHSDFQYSSIQNDISNESYSDCCVSDDADSCCIVPLPQHQFYIGPEIYHVNRKRDNGSKQDGWIYGGRIGYDRIKRCRIYWGGDALYATGHLKGHTAGDVRIKSCYTDASVEGRLGYTIQMKSFCFLPTLVPYVGLGWLQETNKFDRSHIKFRTSYEYVSLGFLSQFYLHRNWVVGLNFKARFLFDSRCKVSDRENESFTQKFEHKVQYRVELPIIYRLNCWCDRLAIAAVPFFEYRHYGFQFGFPEDFRGTKLNLYGFDIRLMYMF